MCWLIDFIMEWLIDFIASLFTSFADSLGDLVADFLRLAFVDYMLLLVCGVAMVLFLYLALSIELKRSEEFEETKRVSAGRGGYGFVKEDLPGGCLLRIVFFLFLFIAIAAPIHALRSTGLWPTLTTLLIRSILPGISVWCIVMLLRLIGGIGKGIWEEISGVIEKW